MAQYHNKTNGTISGSLKGGKSFYIPGKAWTEIPLEDEGSEDLQRHLRQGHLYRFDPGEAVLAASVAPEVALEPEIMQVRVSETAPETSSTQEDASGEDNEESKLAKGFRKKKL